MFSYMHAFFRNFYLKPLALIGQVLVLLGLRRRWLYWGTVYDSVSKQPLDPAIVKLVHVPSGQVVGSCVTDMSGRYGFIGWPGKFKILVRKANFEFPSKIAKGDSDGIFSNLYHGDFFQVSGGTEVVSFNIPLDPVNPDWNQEAKKEIVKFSPYLHYFLHSMVRIIFWFVFLLSVLYAYKYGSGLAKLLLVSYGAVFVVTFLVPRPRLWGKVLCRHVPKDAAEITMELSHRKVPSVVVAKTCVFEDGKYFLRVAKGKYLLKARAFNGQGQEIFTKTKKISIGSGGVLNKFIVL